MTNQWKKLTGRKFIGKIFDFLSVFKNKQKIFIEKKMLKKNVEKKISKKNFEKKLSTLLIFIVCH